MSQSEMQCRRSDFLTEAETIKLVDWCIHVYPIPFAFMNDAAYGLAPGTDARTEYQRILIAMLVGFQGLTRSPLFRQGNFTSADFLHLAEAKHVIAISGERRDALLTSTMTPRELRRFQLASGIVASEHNREVVRDTVAFLADAVRNARLS